MPCVRLLNSRQGTATPLVQQFDQVKSIRAAQNRRHVAHLERRRHFGEHGRQAVERTPAKIAATQTIRGIGISGSQLGKVLAFAQPFNDLVGLGAQLLNLLRAGRLGSAQQDMRDLILLAGSRPGFCLLYTSRCV